MGQYGNAIFLLQIGRDMHCVLACAAARAVCDAHKVRAQRCNLLCRLCDRFVCTAGLGWEHLKRQRDFFLLEKI